MLKKTSLALAISMMAAGPAFSGTFTNGGFEDGNLNGWTQGGGYWGYNSGSVYVPYTGGALPTAPQYAGGTSNNTIMSGGTDPITGQNTVYNGNYSVRVNDSNNNYSVSTLTQQVLNYTDNDIFFQWNAVLEASHGLSDSDYFSLTLTDDTTSTVLLTRSYSSASAAGLLNNMAAGMAVVGSLSISIWPHWASWAMTSPCLCWRPIVPTAVTPATSIWTALRR